MFLFFFSDKRVQVSVLFIFNYFFYVYRIFKRSHFAELRCMSQFHNIFQSVSTNLFSYFLVIGCKYLSFRSYPVLSWGLINKGFILNFVSTHFCSYFLVIGCKYLLYLPDPILSVCWVLKGFHSAGLLCLYLSILLYPRLFGIDDRMKGFHFAEMGCQCLSIWLYPQISSRLRGSERLPLWRDGLPVYWDAA